MEGRVQLGPLGIAATNRPIVPAPTDYDDGEIDGMIGRGNRSTRREHAPLLLCSPQIPHPSRTRTRTSAGGEIFKFYTKVVEFSPPPQMRHWASNSLIISDIEKIYEF
jgi:hypothetical protein